MIVSISKSDRDDLRNCCGRKPIVHVLLDIEELSCQYQIVCPVCSSYNSGDSFSLAKADWNDSLDFDNSFMELGG